MAVVEVVGPAHTDCRRTLLAEAPRSRPWTAEMAAAAVVGRIGRWAAERVASSLAVLHTEAAAGADKRGLDSTMQLGKSWAAVEGNFVEMALVAERETVDGQKCPHGCRGEAVVQRWRKTALAADRVVRHRQAAEENDLPAEVVRRSKAVAVGRNHPATATHLPVLAEMHQMAAAHTAAVLGNSDCLD